MNSTQHYIIHFYFEHIGTRLTLRFEKYCNRNKNIYCARIPALILYFILCSFGMWTISTDMYHMSWVQQQFHGIAWVESMKPTRFNVFIERYSNHWLHSPYACHENLFGHRSWFSIVFTISVLVLVLSVFLEWSSQQVHWSKS